MFVYYEGKQLMYAARTRNGFTPPLRPALMKRFQALEINDCPFANLPEGKSGRWGQGLTGAKMKECGGSSPFCSPSLNFSNVPPTTTCGTAGSCRYGRVESPDTFIVSPDSKYRGILTLVLILMLTVCMVD